VIERSVMLSSGKQIDETMLMLHEPSAAASPQTDALNSLASMTMEQVEKLLLEKALASTDGNVSKAARELGLTRMAMRYRMEKYQL
jgi:transcriptional regulator with PAS, ATPase and Fis domain